MDMQINSVIKAATGDEGRAINVGTRDEVDFHIKEGEMSTNLRGRFFYLPTDFEHPYLVAIEGAGYEVQRFTGKRPSGPLGFMSRAEMDAFLAQRGLWTWPTGHRKQLR